LVRAGKGDEKRGEIRRSPVQDAEEKRGEEHIKRKQIYIRKTKGREISNVGEGREKREGVKRVNGIRGVKQQGGKSKSAQVELP